MADLSKTRSMQAPVYVQAYAVPVDASAPSAPPSFNPYSSAPPAAPPAISTSAVPPPQSINYPGAYEYLTAHGWPRGLQDTFLKNLQRVPLRFFICDDSGSMAANDGHKLIKSGGQVKFITCSRWSELTDSLNFHAGLAQAANAKSEFRLLNGAAPIVLGDDRDPDGNKIASLRAIFDNGPNGGTPLCYHIREVTAQITAVAASLRASGQRACVIIATDGESSDGDLAAALRPLKDLPCFVVVRLCTDEDRIVNYWNGIDNDLELEMDVLDDLEGEVSFIYHYFLLRSIQCFSHLQAKEVHAKNGWLTYCLEIQQLREFGAAQKEFDLLDETTLSLEQVKTMCMLIFGGQSSAWPQPEADWNGFKMAVEAGLSSCNQVWCPDRKKMRSWVSLSEIARLRQGGGGGCVMN